MLLAPFLLFTSSFIEKDSLSNIAVRPEAAQNEARRKKQ